MSRAVLLGLIGSGIGASLTPAMHEREGSEQGLRTQYKLIDLRVLNLGAEALPELLLAAERMGFNGLNITHPCKQAVLPLLTTLSDDARFLGAVNTVVLRDGKREGHNTDWWGFAENFRRRMPDAPRKTCRAIGRWWCGCCGGLCGDDARHGASHHCRCRRRRAQSVAGSLCERFGAGRVTAATDPAPAIAEADGLINTSPVGMDKYPGTPVPVSLLRPALWVADIIYFPMETALLHAARGLGCRVLDGGGMAVFQAVGAFGLFTGVQPDPERMLRHFTSLTQVQELPGG